MKELTEANLYRSGSEEEGDQVGYDEIASDDDDVGLVEGEERPREETEGPESKAEVPCDEDEDEDQFSHLVPSNWEQISEMRMRAMEREYADIHKYDMKDTFKSTLDKISMADLEAATKRGLEQRERDEMEAIEAQPEN